MFMLCKFLLVSGYRRKYTYIIGNSIQNLCQKRLLRCKFKKNVAFAPVFGAVRVPWQAGFLRGPPSGRGRNSVPVSGAFSRGSRTVALRSPGLYSAASTRVLSAEYAGGLRKARRNFGQVRARCSSPASGCRPSCAGRPDKLSFCSCGRCRRGRRAAGRGGRVSAGSPGGMQPRPVRPAARGAVIH